MKFFIRKSLVFLMWVFSGSAFAATGLMVPYGAGGATDFQARIVTMVAESDNALAEPVYILNKPGAGGRVGWSWFASRGPVDGSVLASFNVPHFIAQSIGDEVPYSIESFEPIATWGADPAVFVVKADSPYASLEQYISAARSSEMSVSGAGLLVGHHIAALQLAKYADLEVGYIPHPTGGAGALAGVISGDFDAGINNMSDAIRAEQAGSVRILAIFSRERHDFIPSVPTLSEEGYPDIGNESVNYRGVMARKGTPAEQLNSLEAAFMNMFANEKVGKKMKAGGSPLQVLNRAETKKLWFDQQQALEELLADL